MREHVVGKTTYFGQCHHAWALQQEKPGEVCVACGAVCLRDDKTGAIVEFDACPDRGGDR